LRKVTGMALYCTNVTSVFSVS